MDEESHLWKEESCRDRVQRDETEEWRVSGFTGSHAAEERAAVPSGSTQHRAPELLGMCGEVNY